MFGQDLILGEVLSHFYLLTCVFVSKLAKNIGEELLTANSHLIQIYSTNYIMHVKQEGLDSF